MTEQITEMTKQILSLHDIINTQRENINAQRELIELLKSSKTRESRPPVSPRLRRGRVCLKKNNYLYQRGIKQ